MVGMRRANAGHRPALQMILNASHRFLQIMPIRWHGTSHKDRWRSGGQYLSGPPSGRCLQDKTTGDLDTWDRTLRVRNGDPGFGPHHGRNPGTLDHRNPDGGRHMLRDVA
jgi:hypothetical protein